MTVDEFKSKLRELIRDCVENGNRQEIFEAAMQEIQSSCGLSLQITQQPVITAISIQGWQAPEKPDKGEK